MKKIVIFFFAIMLAVVLCACSEDMPDDSSATSSHATATPAVSDLYFTAKVIESGEKALLVEITEAGTSNISLGSQAWISSSYDKITSYADYLVGDYVYVEFDGMVMESYPLQINSVTYIVHSDVLQEKKVVNIIDKTVNSDIVTADALQGFFHDDMYDYYFSSIKSQYVVVEYSDGSTETVESAINENRITIADLDAYNIGYYREPRNIENIIDHAELDGLPTDQAEEVFYTDDEYVYTFPSIRSEYVIVYYKDGTSQPIKDAITDGKLQIEDLKHFGIFYYSSPKK